MALPQRQNPVSRRDDLASEGDHLLIGRMIGPEKGWYRDKVARLVADAEEAGFTSICVPQLPGDFDALTVIAVMGRATERVELRRVA